MPLDTAGRLDVACTSFRERLCRLTEHDMALGTPCEGWDVAQLVDHAIGTLRFASDALGSRPWPIASPLAAFDDAVRAVREPLADARLAATVVDTPFGRLAYKQLVSSVVVHDVLVHAWDLARATGQDDTLDEVLCAHVLVAMSPFDEVLRSHGFAEKVPAPPGADAQTQLLCFLGRRP